ncbi:KH domain protein [Opisthorchis viverrini]|uniref:Branchpoint-bridging protein n=1 Tax=Opisthorchis viverrini TaxID=6198 RepID=A0A1S8X673_OPIVI|nr:KH domain protein [Opisthorchis viverrini]
MSKRILAISDGSDSYGYGRKSRSPGNPIFWSFGSVPCMAIEPEPTPRKRKSRWSSAADSDRTYIPGMPTQLPPNMTPLQEKIYISSIEDISRRLKSGDLGIPKNPEDRSPSPEPIYSSEGKRLNTREYRTRKKMEDERHTLVQQLTELNPDYKPPTDYKPPQNRVTDKVFIPQENHPDINFVGLLIGPRGNTLKALEKETGAKIIIRGKGSVKEGKVGRRDGLPLPGEDEPLHAFVSAPVAEAVQKAVRRINEIIRQGIEVPESQNDLRRAQLRELALLNGTLREHEGLMKLRAMAEAQSIATNKIQCGICGGAGHLSTDCKVNLSGMAYTDQLNTNPSERAKMDSEYSALMAELGVGAGSMLPGMGRGLRSQAPRPPRQPPPPGVAPSEEDDEDVNTSAVNGTSNTTVTSTQNAMPSNQPYPYGLPPPPPLPGSQYPPMMSGVGGWPNQPVMPPVAGYPPGATYPPGPSGTGAYTIPTTSNGTGMCPTPWPSNPTPGGWGDAPSMGYGGPGMVPQPYSTGPGNYWGGYYPQPIPNPPPPPPPGV